MNIQKQFIATLITALVGAIPLYAAEPQIEQSTIPAISGGIGDEEMDDIVAIQHHYSLKLIFAKPNGEYLANVHVQIRDSKGNEVINADSKGPVFLAHLNPGTYKATASLEGKSRTQDIVLHDHLEFIIYYMHLDAK